MSEVLQRFVRLGGGRRSFLRQSGGAVLSATAMALLARRSLAADEKKTGAVDNDLGILNKILGAEYQAVAAYQVGAESGLLQKPVLDLATHFQGQHKDHAEFMEKTVKTLGGTPVEPKAAAEYNFPLDKLKTQDDVLRFAAGLEKAAASAYLGAVPLFSSRDLARDAASILGDEAMHWAVLRQALGEDPVPQAYIS